MEEEELLIISLGQLAKLTAEETSTYFPRYANYVRSLLPGRDVETSQAASHALASLVAAVGEPLASEMVEFEYSRALSWIKEKHEMGQFAAMGFLRELARACPHLIITMGSTVLEACWTCLQACKSPSVKDITVDAMRSILLCFAAARGEPFDHGGRVPSNSSKTLLLNTSVNDVLDASTIRKLIEAALVRASAQGSKANNAIVGFLAGLKVFLEAHNPCWFEGDIYFVICDYALQLVDSQEGGPVEAAIRTEAFHLIAEAAAINAPGFAQRYLSRWVTILTDALSAKAEKERILAIHVLARTVEGMRGCLSGTCLQAICTSLATLLATRYKKKHNSHHPPYYHHGYLIPVMGEEDEVTEVMKCAAMMASSVETPILQECITILLPAILMSPDMTFSMRNALLAIAHALPSLMPLIEDRVLAFVITTLRSFPSVVTEDVPPEGDTLDLSIREEESVAFACETLALFTYSEPLLEGMVGKLLWRLLRARRSGRVREAAALAIASLIRHSATLESFSSVLRVITALLTMAASDEDVGVRLVVMQSLNDEVLDFYLSASEPFHILLMILASGTLPCRLLAVAIIERISRTNTGILFPHFRTLLLQNFADLACPYPESVPEEAAIIISEIVKFNPVLIRTIVDPLLRALSPRLLDANATTATAVITTLTRLVSVNPAAFGKHALSLINSAAKILNDQSSSKRRLAALSFLSSLLRNVRACVPFERLAELLLEAAELLKIELVRPVRNEAIKLMGVIGALDPYKLRSREMELKLSGGEMLAGAPSTGGLTGGAADGDVGDDETGPAGTWSGGGTAAMSTLHDEYYFGIAVSALLKILRDASLNRLHPSAIQALLAVCQAMGVRSSMYLNELMPIWMNLLRSSSDHGNTGSAAAGVSGIVNFVLNSLASLIMTVGLHMRPWAGDITAACTDLWTASTMGGAGHHHTKLSIMALLKALAEGMAGEAVPGLNKFVPLLVSYLASSHDGEVLISLLRTLRAMSSYARDHVHSIVLAIGQSVFVSGRDYSLDGQVTREALSLTMELADRADIRLELPLIVPWIKRAIEWPGDRDALRTLRHADRLACYIYVNFAEEFEPLTRLVPSAKLPSLAQLRSAASLSQATNMTVSPDIALLSINLNDLSLASPLTATAGAGEYHSTLVQSSQSSPTLTTAPMAKLTMNEANLRRSWDPFECNSKEDWFQWIRRLEAELLKESPAPALRACANLAAMHYPLSRDLFNAAFVACWSELPDVLQDELVGCLESALASLSIPSEVMQIILNLAEFMERDDRPLPIDAASLGAYAMKCHAYAKALYYQEAEFMASPSAESVEALIGVASQLSHPDSAVGALVCAQRNYGIRLEESWYEKLQRWDDALIAYKAKWETDQQSFDSLLGIFRCWHALGDWESVGELAAQVWPDLPSSVQAAVVPLAAAAAWSEGNWDRMAAYVERVSEATPEGAVFRAVLAINRQAYGEAERYVTMTRESLDTELTAMLSESYGRAYNTIVRAQTLSELEEVIQYCQASHDISRRDAIRSCWSQRLDDCQVSVDVWQRILKIRSLVLPPEDAQQRWIKFASLCRRNDRPILAHKILLMLLRVDENSFDTLDLTQAAPPVVYGFLKHNWEIGEREVAVRFMRQYAKYLAAMLDRRLSSSAAAAAVAISGNSSPIGLPQHPAGGYQTHQFHFQQHMFPGDAAEVERLSKLLARCHCKLGEWQKTLAAESGEEPGAAVVESYLAATSYDKTWYKAWHGWALVNFEMAMAAEKKARKASIPGKENGKGGREMLASATTASPSTPPRNPYLVPAIQGFFRSISLSGGNSLQDSLRLLTLWFKYGALAEVNAAIGDGFHMVPVDNWLQVIPQLIARIHVPTPQVRRLIHHLLTDIGRQHPQALIYPLTVASKSQSVSRRTGALAILDKMRSHSARLVEQALLVSQELIRVAILWEEMWYEGLEEASKLYICDNNFAGMCSILEPLHQMIEAGQETAKEREFVETYGVDLKEAREQCLRYKRTGNASDLSAAWELYYQVFRRIGKQLPHLGPIDLQQAAPKLLAARNLDIAVPGSYRAVGGNGEVVRISSFHGIIGVINSKQRPRKLILMGDDGKRYKYLLKGHEDLRQDQRVMQLFGLVNTILAADGETRKRHLTIERFAVVPLSQNTGLIGWVPHCDTIHSLIRDYREARGVLLSIEHRLMLQFAPDYDHLLLLGKIEVFEHALSNTDGRDLGRIMWHRSLNSEVWLERRLAYTRSLAVMSMVGYILGLGDRHPSNLMLDQVSGRVVHIDFGDCFEVAMQRDKFPEKVPFRLTRMLVKAMEVSGIEGSYRITAEHTMRVLRANKDSLMAVLEAFVYDPLINWRLLTKTMVRTTSVRSSAGLLPTASRLSAGLLSMLSQQNETISEDAEFPENFSSSRRVRRDAEISRLEDESINRPEAVNAGALNVISRVSNKLTGKDFARQPGDPNNPSDIGNRAPLEVPVQVDRLIVEATRVENLCQAYVGWCAFW